MSEDTSLSDEAIINNNYVVGGTVTPTIGVNAIDKTDPPQSRSFLQSFNECIANGYKPPENANRMKTPTKSTRDGTVRTEIRRVLPSNTFRRSPSRVLLVLPVVGTIVLLSTAIACSSLPCYVDVLVSLMIGNSYASLMFLAHEVAHEATVRSRKIQDVVLYLACTVFCFSPHLWRVWHNAVHHSHTNDASADPDNFGTLEAFLAEHPSRRAFAKFAPGMSWLGLVYLFVFFALQAQSVLWVKSRRMPGFERLRRSRCIIDSLLMLLFWIALGCVLGPVNAIYVVILPALFANFVVLAYVLTNHLLMPLTSCPDTLRTTMSVTTNRLIDKLHFHFSHHVEHHLFPNMPSSKYPLVRAFLKENYPTVYMAPAHWRALMALFLSPRIYESEEVLCDPYTGRRKSLSLVHSSLADERTAL